MAAIALELNDAGLLLLREGSPRPGAESPGLALFEEGAVLVGAPAAAVVWRKPRSAFDRFWDPPSLEALGLHAPPGVRRADLAHAHLRSLREALPEPPSEAILAVPGFWDRTALGLALSLARAAGFPVVGLLDSAVAGAAFFARAGELLHLDLTRHRSLVTTLRGGPVLERVRLAEAEGCGQAAFERALVEALARRCVHETRFDPLHSGDSEQRVHDALPGWLAELRREGTCAVRLPGGRREHRFELSRQALAAELEPLYRMLVDRVRSERGPATLLVTARAARLPGLLERLRDEGGLAVVELPRDAAVSAALRFRSHVRHAGEALPLVTRLPLGKGA
jgi:hypothetical protein